MINHKPSSAYRCSGIARELIVADFFFVSNSQNGKNLNLLSVDEKDESKSPSIHEYIVVDFLVSGNNYSHNPCLQANTVNARVYNSLVMNAGGVA